LSDQTVTLKAKRKVLFGILGIVLSSSIIQSCGWKQTMAFPSPSRKVAIEVWQTRFANERGTKIVLAAGQQRTVLDRIDREAIIYFVHVYWSPDEKTVGVLATELNYSRAAYDIDKGKPIPFDDIREGLGHSIGQAYHVPWGENPVEWAATADAQTAFFKLHPEIQLSYHSK
jgi:hypothetical protein